MAIKTTEQLWSGHWSTIDARLISHWTGTPVNLLHSITSDIFCKLRAIHGTFRPGWSYYADRYFTQVYHSLGYKKFHDFSKTTRAFFQNSVVSQQCLNTVTNSIFSFWYLALFYATILINLLTCSLAYLQPRKRTWWQQLWLFSSAETCLFEAKTGKFQDFPGGLRSWIHCMYVITISCWTSVVLVLTSSTDLWQVSKNYTLKFNNWHSVKVPHTLSFYHVIQQTTHSVYTVLQHTPHATPWWWWRHCGGITRFWLIVHSSVMFVCSTV